nr:Protein-tyrosine sulfotransferase [Hymenolepis microstoma]
MNVLSAEANLQCGGTQMLLRTWRRGDLVDEVPNSEITSEYHHEAVLYLVEHLDPDDLTGTLGQRIMEYALNCIIPFEDGYPFLRLLMNKHSIMPDGTYRNIESNSLNVKFLTRYIEEMYPFGDRPLRFRCTTMDFSFTERLQKIP